LAPPVLRKSFNVLVEMATQVKGARGKSRYRCERFLLWFGKTPEITNELRGPIKMR
jgi:hypothetical protein